MASAISVPNESIGSRSRSTTDGRRITYRLSVVQQPERARACGQGAKSSTDRRPVDPPPIIELRVFEGEENSQTDITFQHKANFFLFATLESARPMAHGRVSQSQPNNVILTGSSVAGMSYLDRPKPAGYFIFPDLSVRHEGTYRLAFTLFEELKDPRDVDPNDRDATPTRAGQDHVSGRAEVRTIPFTVFSAKKFPGLAESTALSRMVADQGCRVRIRRDVRMRRRETKSGKDFDEYGDDGPERDASPTPYDRNPASASDPPAEKGRQLERPASMSSNVQHLRHSSSQDFNQQYQSAYAAPQQSHQQNYGQHMSYDSKPIHQYPYPPQNPPYAQQHQMMQAPPHMGHYQQSPYQYPPGMMQYAQAQFHAPAGYLPPQQMQSPTYDQSVSGMRQEGLQFVPTHMNQEHRNSQSQQYHPQGQHAAPLGPIENGYPRSPPPSQGTMYSRHNSNHSGSGQASGSGKDLPPIQTQTPQMHHTPTGITSPTSAGIREGSASYNYSSRPPPPPPPQYSADVSNVSRKRSYASTFDTQHLDQPLRDGQRPTTSGVDNTDHLQQVSQESSSSDDDQFEMSQMKMRYRRADGTEVVRGWPPV